VGQCQARTVIALNLLDVMLAELLLLAAFAQTPALQAQSLLDAGIELSHRGRFQDAADKFVQALALNPKLAEAHYLLGLVRQHDGRIDSALASFRSALKINPRYAEAQARVCELLTRAARARDAGFEVARTSCRRAVLLNPNDPEPHFHLGWAEAKLGSLTQAIREYQTALQLDPKFPRVKLELAIVHMDSQDTDRAIALLREVVAAEPANGVARFELGSALAKKGDCAAAIPLLETASETDRKYYVLAGCLKKLNRETEAAAALEKVKDLRRGADARMQAKYRAAVAQKNMEAGKLDEAIAEFRAALDLVKDVSIAVDLAVALLKNGQPQEVIALLGQQDDPLGRYQVSLAYTKLGRFEEARTTLEAALRTRPKFAEAWYQLGVVRIATDRIAEAESAFRMAVELRPDERAFRLAWAEVLKKLGRLDEAARQEGLATKVP
jgi:tetratricopeptide (TPR) repeat protein